LPHRFRTAWLIGITALFLIIFDVRSFVVLSLDAAIVAYLAQTRKPPPVAFLAAGIGVVGVLIYYKISAATAGSDAVTDFGIPLGLSYFAFRTLHVIYELYRGTIPAQRMLAAIGYLFFIPTIIVGPINRAAPFFEDRTKAGLNFAEFSQGLERILFGYFKIAFLGNFLMTQKLGGYIQSLQPGHEALKLYLLAIQSSLNLYVQFSGFSDVAIGFALLLGYRVMENFRWPYLQANIGDFWRCWHISLTSWSRDYIYMPLVGMYRNPYLANVAAFGFIGLWHEASLRYLVWGLYHAAGVIVWQKWQTAKRRRPWLRKLAILPAPVGKAVATVVTFNFVVLSFLIVATPDLPSAARAFGTVLFGWA
jgi:alginate O-acetyltransferase complex protein AlgI